MAVNDCDVIRQGVEPRADGLGIAARTEVVEAESRVTASAASTRYVPPRSVKRF